MIRRGWGKQRYDCKIRTFRKLHAAAFGQLIDPEYQTDQATRSGRFVAQYPVNRPFNGLAIFGFGDVTLGCAMDQLGMTT